MHETYEVIDQDGHGDHQLLPVRGGRYDKVFHGPPGEDVGDLHTDIEPVGITEGKVGVVVHSGWQPNEEQVRQVGAGAHIRLSVWMYPIPPMAMSVEPPVCGCHGTQMTWEPDDGVYHCGYSRNVPVEHGNTSDHKVDPSSSLEQAHRDFKPGEEL